jgi:hypothetical protein
VLVGLLALAARARAVTLQPVGTFDQPGYVTSPPEIWSLGLRNPFRFSFDHLTGDLVIADVGAGTSEVTLAGSATSGFVGRIVLGVNPKATAV